MINNNYDLKLMIYKKSAKVLFVLALSLTFLSISNCNTTKDMKILISPDIVGKMAAFTVNITHYGNYQSPALILEYEYEWEFNK